MNSCVWSFEEGGAGSGGVGRVCFAGDTLLVLRGRRLYLLRRSPEPSLRCLPLEEDAVEMKAGGSVLALVTARRLRLFEVGEELAERGELPFQHRFEGLELDRAEGQPVALAADGLLTVVGAAGEWRRGVPAAFAVAQARLYLLEERQLIMQEGAAEKSCFFRFAPGDAPQRLHPLARDLLGVSVCGAAGERLEVFKVRRESAQRVATVAVATTAVPLLYSPAPGLLGVFAAKKGDTFTLASLEAPLTAAVELGGGRGPVLHACSLPSSFVFPDQPCAQTAWAVLRPSSLFFCAPDESSLLAKLLPAQPAFGPAGPARVERSGFEGIPLFPLKTSTQKTLFELRKNCRRYTLAGMFLDASNNPRGTPSEELGALERLLSRSEWLSEAAWQRLRRVAQICDEVDKTVQGLQLRMDVTTVEDRKEGAGSITLLHTKLDCARNQAQDQLRALKSSKKRGGFNFDAAKVDSISLNESDTTAFDLLRKAFSSPLYIIAEN